MKIEKYMLFIVVFCIIHSFAQKKIETRNAVLKDVNGKTYDLIKILDSGKYIYFMGGYLG